MLNGAKIVSMLRLGCNALFLGQQEHKHQLHEIHTMFRDRGLNNRKVIDFRTGVKFLKWFDCNENSFVQVI